MYLNFNTQYLRIQQSDFYDFWTSV